MRILSLDPTPLHEMRYLNAGRSPGAFTEDRLPVLLGVASGLPDSLDAIVVASDLQGREPFDHSRGQPPRLIGVALAEQLAEQWLHEWQLPPSPRVGVILAGDLWSEPALDARGGIGDVSDVWHAFGRRFAWVAGVAGNHDAFGGEPDEPPRFKGNLHFLDGHRANIGGLHIAGVSGIIGNPRKPWRRTDEDYLTLLETALEGNTDVLILHDGPDAPPRRFKGHAIVRELIERRRPRLVVRGHDHWDEPLVELSSGTQVLKVDKRVVVLRPSP